MALLILALLQRIFLMSSLMLLLVWLIFFMVLIKLLPIDRKSGSAGMPRPISYAVFCLKKKITVLPRVRDPQGVRDQQVLRVGLPAVRAARPRVRAVVEERAHRRSRVLDPAHRAPAAVGA